jgi:protein-S-isoprenylcysteine O-methyltransferase Ste14
MIVGLLIAIAASRVFRAAGTSFKLHGNASHLVTDGPFHITRNPMYLGMLMWFVGLSVLLGTLAPLLFAALLFLFLNFVIIPMEERSLREIHGQKYAEYEGRVRRWL